MSASPEHPVVDALYRISSLVGGAVGPRDALEVIIDEIMRVLPCSSASIELLHPETQTLEVEVFRGLPEHAKGLQLRLGEGVTGWVALHGEPLLVNNVAEDARYVPVAPNIRSEMAVPMKGDREALLAPIIGVVNVDSTEADAFTDRDLKVLTLLTNEASRAVQQLWLMERLEEKANQLQALLQVGRALVRKRETREVIPSLVRETRRLLAARISALFLLDDRGEHLVLQAVQGPNGALAHRETLALRDSTLGTVARRRKILEVQDLARTEEHHFVGLAQREGLIGMLACPIYGEQEVIGTLSVYTGVPHRFSNDERRALETLASLGGVAIQNARLYTRIFQSEDILRRSERLTTLGLLSAEIAHEIRNPLTVLRLLFDSLDLRFPPEDLRNRDVAVIAEKLTQLEEIVNRVLQFGKSREDLRSRYPLGKVIDDTLHLVRVKLAQQHVDLDVEDGPETLFVDISKGQIQQVVLNLIINATQAMPNGGQIVLRSRRVLRGDQAMAQVDLRDTGAGVPPHLRGKIFDSFLSGHAEGTGLGLSIVKRILVSHGGDVELASTGPNGTTMRFWLPLAV